MTFVLFSSLSTQPLQAHLLRSEQQLRVCHGFLVSICASSLHQGNGRELKRCEFPSQGEGPRGAGGRAWAPHTRTRKQEAAWVGLRSGGPQGSVLISAKSQAAFSGRTAQPPTDMVSIPQVNSDSDALESGQGVRAPGLGPRKSQKPQRVASWGRVGTKKSSELKLGTLPLTSQVTQGKYRFLSDLHKVTELY